MKDFDGILNIIKPAGISSFQCLSVVKRRLWEQMPADTRPKFKNWKVGHLGTLDPAASGVLVLLCGKATKLNQQLSGGTKVYRSVFTFGIETDTLDREGKVTKQSNVIPTKQQIEAILPSMVGDVEIEVPKFSAVHINGQRAYDMARKGVNFIPPKKVVSIKRFKLLGDVFPCGDEQFQKLCKSFSNFAFCILHSALFEIECETGTYIRSLAKLIAQKLGTVAYCAEIIRTRVGEFKIEDAKNLDEVTIEDIITTQNMDIR